MAQETQNNELTPTIISVPKLTDFRRVDKAKAKDFGIEKYQQVAKYFADDSALKKKAIENDASTNIAAGNAKEEITKDFTEYISTQRNWQAHTAALNIIDDYGIYGLKYHGTQEQLYKLDKFGNGNVYKIKLKTPLASPSNQQCSQLYLYAAEEAGLTEKLTISCSPKKIWQVCAMITTATALGSRAPDIQTHGTNNKGNTLPDGPISIVKENENHEFVYHDTVANTQDEINIGEGAFSGSNLRTDKDIKDRSKRSLEYRTNLEVLRNSNETTVQYQNRHKLEVVFGLHRICDSSHKLSKISSPIEKQGILRIVLKYLEEAEYSSNNVENDKNSSVTQGATLNIESREAILEKAGDHVKNVADRTKKIKDFVFKEMANDEEIPDTLKKTIQGEEGEKGFELNDGMKAALEPLFCKNGKQTVIHPDLIKKQLISMKVGHFPQVYLAHQAKQSNNPGNIPPVFHFNRLGGTDDTFSLDQIAEVGFDAGETDADKNAKKELVDLKNIMNNPDGNMFGNVLFDSKDGKKIQAMIDSLDHKKVTEQENQKKGYFSSTQKEENTLYNNAKKAFEDRNKAIGYANLYKALKFEFDEHVKTSKDKLGYELEELNDNKNALEEQKKDLNGVKNKLKGKKKALEDQKKGLITTIEANEKQKAMLEANNKALDEEIPKLEKEIEELESNKDIKAKDEKIRQLLGIKTKKEKNINDINNLTSKIEQKNDKSLLKTIDRDIESSQTDIEKCDGKISNIKQNLDENKTEIKNIQKKQKEVKQASNKALQKTMLKVMDKYSDVNELLEDSGKAEKSEREANNEKYTTLKSNIIAEGQPQDASTNLDNALKALGDARNTATNYKEEIIKAKTNDINVNAKKLVSEGDKVSLELNADDSKTLEK